MCHPTPRPAPSLLHVNFQLKHISERIGDQVDDVPVPRSMPEIIEVPAPALVIEHVAPTSADAHAAPADVIDVAPSPVIEYIAQ